jgi:putative peptide zinc metalloprotease protein
MTKPVAANEVERRKHVRIRLRPDLDVTLQKYEGRSYWVVKDPVALRYYRFKEQERFLIDAMDGSNTLDEVQKEYEKRFRPERLTLEDLESFAHQLINAGLALNESPRAGQQLYERRNKRIRSEWMQTLTNILYIKIPIFDPDRLLTHMLKYMWWIFTPWFLAVSVAVMLAAVALVATHFETFREKLPAYHEFFSFKTAIYLWIALGVVKVIHEFGHGLSCKAFGGEVHEMGALFLCLSPCLYCNVSDAWTLPSKWRRIIISGAGIYVELIIAAIATFIWWNSSSQPFVHNLSLSLMVVCSVSTVVFNANPLMRYDGYFVVADWLEVPNLRDRSNRFLKNLMMEICLGVETDPEPYMTLSRKTLFVIYAVVSYVYRWVVTFSILYLMYNWLPVKLRVISSVMTLFAAGSMVGWPLYRLGKNIHKRGRLPDMKTGRVIITSSVVAAVLLAIVLVPLPFSRVIQTGVVQLNPHDSKPVKVEAAGNLEFPLVEDGQPVARGAILGGLWNPSLVQELKDLKNERDSDERHRAELHDELQLANREPDPSRRDERRKSISVQIDKLKGDIVTLNKKIEGKQMEVDGLAFKAPQSGLVFNVPRTEEVGRYWDPEQNSTFCTVADPEKLIVLVPVTNQQFKLLSEDMEAARASGETLRATVRVQGMVDETWQGEVLPLPEEVAREGEIPPQLTTRHGGPLAIKPGTKQGVYIPQNQQYLVSVAILKPDHYIAPGALAQVKIHCRWRTARWWIWNKITDIFDLPLW